MNGGNKADSAQCYMALLQRANDKVTELSGYSKECVALLGKEFIYYTQCLHFLYVARNNKKTQSLALNLQ